MSIFEKLVQIMGEIKPVGKDGTNNFHNYKYASEAAIVTEVREALIKHKVAFTYNMIKYDRSPADEKGNCIGTAVIEFYLTDAEKPSQDPGNCVKSVVFGEGQDKGDKAIYKAITGAEKYFLLKTFLIPTTYDTEADSKTNQDESRQIKANQAKHPIEDIFDGKEINPGSVVFDLDEGTKYPTWEWMMSKSELFTKANGKSAYKKGGISESQLNRFQVMFHKAGLHLERVQEMCEAKKLPVDLTDLTYKQLEELEGHLKLKAMV